MPSYQRPGGPTRPKPRPTSGPAPQSQTDLENRPDLLPPDQDKPAGGILSTLAERFLDPLTDMAQKVTDGRAPTTGHHHDQEEESADVVAQPDLSAIYGRVSGDPPLGMGDMGWRVHALQQALMHHGADIELDGQYGRRTVNAVRAFQAQHELQVTGIVGKETAEVLNGLRGPGPSQDEDQTVDLDSDQAAEPLTGSPLVKRGDRGGQVLSLQRALDAAGFSIGITGDFDWPTYAALKAYQRSRGLVVDGQVGPKTAEALRTGTPAKDPAADTDVDPKKLDFDPGNRLGHASMNPMVVGLTEQTCQALQDLGYFPYVVSGFRSFGEQDAIYEQGRTKPGPKVTWVKGGGSWHNYGLAVDIAFWNANASGPSWEGHHPWSQIGQQGLAAGFTRWGGDFGDRPHLEYHPQWEGGASGLASTYQSEGLDAVWKKVGA